jgi:hypothetical protein
MKAEGNNGVKGNAQGWGNQKSAPQLREKKLGAVPG